jgi:hypothetical protein
MNEDVYLVAVSVIQFISFTFLFVDVIYLNVYFSYNFKYQMISDSSYVGITASEQPNKRKSYGLMLWRRQMFTVTERLTGSAKAGRSGSTTCPGYAQ